MLEPNQDIDWNALVMSLHHRECILMIGPDAITESVGDRSVSIMRLFSDELIDKLSPDEDLKSAYLNPAQVAQVFKQRMNSCWALRSTAQEFFKGRIESTTPSLKKLATLPFRLVIDTTPLRQMELAFIEARKPFVEKWYKKKAPPQDIEEPFDDERPLVYHIFGSMNDPQSMVLAEDEFVDLIFSFTKGDPSLPPTILNSFSSECSMLFIGFGVRHLLLRILLHVLNSGRSTDRSFALERFNDDLGDRTVKGVKLLFKYGQRIDFLDMELDTFVDRLCAQYQNCLRAYGLSPECVEKTVQQPKIFISYRHEDKTIAEHLRKQLEELGIDVWQDVDRLRAGENWDQTIKQVIHSVDFFVLLLSRALFETTEGFVIKELNQALDRKTGILGTFIMPVWIDDYRPAEDHSLLFKLKGYHISDVRTQESIEKLASSIRRNHQTNKKTFI